MDQAMPSPKSKSHAWRILGLGVVVVLLVGLTLLLVSGKNRLVWGDLKAIFQQSPENTPKGQLTIIKMRLLGLAHAMWESSHRTYPASAQFVDADGRPLLSWRVAILAQDEQTLPLFLEFHLDEPWDSPHNLTLVSRMPDMFSDPWNPELAAEGKTRYLVPVHPQSAFPPAPDAPTSEAAKTTGSSRVVRARGIRFAESKDGFSETMMIVLAPPKLAQIWTKPADWEVDLDHAWEQLQGNNPPATLFFGCGDAHVEAREMNSEKLKANLPKLITISGGESVQW